MRANVAQRKKHADKTAQFIDLPMETVVREPVACVEKIYGHFGLGLPEDVLAAMERYMQEHALAKRTKHVYAAEDFGLDLEAIWPRFQFYRDHYGISDRRP